MSFQPTPNLDAPGSVKIARQGVFQDTYPNKGTQAREEYSVTPESTGALTKFEEYYEPDNDNKVYTVADNGWYYVLPVLASPAPNSYTLSVKLTKNGDIKTAVVPAEFMTWLPGYQYTYIFTITEEGDVEIGSVQTAFNTWTDVDSQDRPVYNW